MPHLLHWMNHQFTSNWIDQLTGRWTRLTEVSTKLNLPILRDIFCCLAKNAPRGSCRRGHYASSWWSKYSTSFSGCRMRSISFPFFFADAGPIKERKSWPYSFPRWAAVHPYCCCSSSPSYSGKMRSLCWNCYLSLFHPYTVSSTSWIPFCHFWFRAFYVIYKSPVLFLCSEFSSGSCTTSNVLPHWRHTKPYHNCPKFHSCGAMHIFFFLDSLMELLAHTLL